MPSKARVTVMSHAPGISYHDLRRNGTVDVLIAGTESNLDVGVPIRYNFHGLTMVYDKHGAVSYWKVYGTINWYNFVFGHFSLTRKKV